MNGETLSKDIKSVINTVYQQANGVSGGTLTILLKAIQGFGKAEAAVGAAAIAYYALFSLFPLLLFLVVFASSILQSEEVQRQVLDFLGEVLPASQQELVESNIEQVLRLRGTVSIIGTVGLLWAASGVFSVLTHNINQAWHTAEARGFLGRRLMGLTMVGGLVGVLVLSLVFTTALNLLSQFEIPLAGSVLIYESFVWTLLSRLLPMTFIFSTFLLLYKWVPNTRVTWFEAGSGALVAMLGWELTKAGFGWYLRSGLASHQLVYGSLGAVVALMLWIYLSGLIILFGAHLSAAVAYHKRLEEEKN